MSNDKQNQQPIADPASQHTDRADTSIVPDLTADPAEAERERLDDASDDSTLER